MAPPSSEIYNQTRVIYQVVFDDEPGLQMACTGTSMGRILKMSKMQTKLDPSNTDLGLFKMFAKRLVAWNLGHPEVDNDDPDDETCDLCGLKEGELLTTTVTGLLCLSPKFVMKLILGWMQAVAGVSLPKGLNSSDGAETPEELMNELANLQSRLT